MYLFLANPKYTNIFINIVVVFLLYKIYFPDIAYCADGFTDEQGSDYKDKPVEIKSNKTNLISLTLTVKNVC